MNKLWEKTLEAQRANHATMMDQFKSQCRSQIDKLQDVEVKQKDEQIDQLSSQIRDLLLDKGSILESADRDRQLIAELQQKEQFQQSQICFLQAQVQALQQDVSIQIARCNQLQSSLDSEGQMSEGLRGQLSQKQKIIDGLLINQQQFEK